MKNGNPRADGKEDYPSKYLLLTNIVLWQHIVLPTLLVGIIYIQHHSDHYADTIHNPHQYIYSCHNNYFFFEALPRIELGSKLYEGLVLPLNDRAKLSRVQDSNLRVREHQDYRSSGVGLCPNTASYQISTKSMSNISLSVPFFLFLSFITRAYNFGYQSSIHFGGHTDEYFSSQEGLYSNT